MGSVTLIPLLHIKCLHIQGGVATLQIFFESAITANGNTVIRLVVAENV